MSDKIYCELGKLIIDLLVNFERLQFSSGYDKVDNPNSIYLFYSSTLKLINKVISADKRDARIFRLKYHHILSNESVDEYLFHCLSKILSDLMDIENNYQKFIQPVADLHMKLMSIVTNIQVEHEKIIKANRLVQIEVQKKQEKKDVKGLDAINSDKIRAFNPVYFLPNNFTNKKVKKLQSLTFQAIHSYYVTKPMLDKDLLDMLLDFDNSFAEFELEFVCQVNKTSIYSISRAELTLDVAVMFSETVSWAHSMNLLEYRAIAECDIGMMVGIPRITVLYGCGIANEGPLSEWALNCHNDEEIEERIAPVFQEHRLQLCRLRRQLNALNYKEINHLCKILMDHNELHQVQTNILNHDKLSKFESVDDGNIITGDMHALFKLISSVSDRMQSKHASDYRFFMETVFKLYKDEDDANSIQSVNNSNSFTASDLFLSQYKNVLSIYTNIDEAVDALSYSLVEQFPDDRCCDLSILAQMESKTYLPSPVHTNKENASFSRQQSITKHISTQSLDSSVQLGRPQWRADSFFPKCCHCDRSFNIFRRRHHCRRCGYLFCNSCWGTKLALPTLGIHTRVSICIECEEFLRGKASQSTASPQSASSS